MLKPAGEACGYFKSAAAWVGDKTRNVHLWLPQYATAKLCGPKPVFGAQPVDVFIAVCDHFEPEQGRGEKRAGLEKVHRWVGEYPQLFDHFHDSSGRTPQHTFFYPADEYAPEYLDPLAELCATGRGDVEVHLHHDNDTPAGLRDTLAAFTETLSLRHGLLRRDPATGEIAYGFIHGNWSLCNSRRDGRWCGVNQEIPILRETGCYADFTLPSAPSDTQTSTINSIYYAVDRPGRPRSHERGEPARVGAAARPDGLLMIQGPLGFDWRGRRAGKLPKIENGNVQANQPPTWPRFLNWVEAGVSVAGRPEWIFVKLHTHGAKNGNIDLWLGDAVQRFHAELARQARDNPLFRYHYVTAWEMAQLVHHAEHNAPANTLPVPMAVAQSA